MLHALEASIYAFERHRDLIGKTGGSLRDSGESAGHARHWRTRHKLPGSRLGPAAVHLSLRYYRDDVACLLVVEQEIDELRDFDEPPRSGRSPMATGRKLI